MDNTLIPFSLFIALVAVGAGTAIIVQVIKQFEVPKRILNVIALVIGVVLMFIYGGRVAGLGWEQNILWGLVAGAEATWCYSFVKKTLMGKTATKPLGQGGP